MAAHHIIPDWPRVFSGCCRRVSLDRTLGAGISQGLTFWLVPNNSFKREAASRLPLIQALDARSSTDEGWFQVAAFSSPSDAGSSDRSLGAHVFLCGALKCRCRF